MAGHARRRPQRLRLAAERTPDSRSAALWWSTSRPQVYRDYRIQVPFSGVWREVLNTDSAIYGGSDVGNGGAVRTLDEGTIPELSLVVPPLAAIFLVPER